jgi:hypothetical protein
MDMSINRTSSRCFNTRLQPLASGGRRAVCRGRCRSRGALNQQFERCLRAVLAGQDFEQRHLLEHSAVHIARGRSHEIDEQRMAQADIGRLPVLRGERLVGLVTRRDVLAILYANVRA